MKKILSNLLPSFLFPLLVCIDRFIMPDSSRFILLWIYIVFPLIFIIQGILYTSSAKFMVIGFSLSAISVLLSTSIGYNMGSMIIPIIIYLLLGIIFNFFSKKLRKKQKQI